MDYETEGTKPRSGINDNMKEVADLALTSLYLNRENAIVHHLSGHFPVKLRLARCPMIIRGVEESFLWTGYRSSHPNNSIKAVKD